MSGRTVALVVKKRPTRPLVERAREQRRVVALEERRDGPFRRTVRRTSPVGGSIVG